MFFSWLEDAVQHHGAAHAVVQRDTYLSFRGLLHRARRRMQELKAMGVGKGHVVGLLLGNVADYLVVAVAVDGLEAALLPIPPLCSAWELGALLERLPVRALITRPGSKALDAESRRAAGEAAGPAPTKQGRMQGSLLSCALYKVDAKRAVPPGTALIHAYPQWAAGGGATKEGVVTYRLVHRRRDQLRAEAEHLSAALRLVEGDRQRLAVALPLCQPLNLELVLALGSGYGAELQLDDDLAPRRLLPRLREGGANLAPLSRAQLCSLVESSRDRPLPPALRALCVDGAVGRERAREAQRVLSVRPRGALHLPETGLVSVDADGRGPQGVGTPVAGVQVRILGARGQPVSGGRKGRLQVRSPAVSGDGLEPAPDPQGWFDTGLLATQDKQGRLRIRGSASEDPDRLFVGGLPVSLGEIRQALCSHPAVVDAAVDDGTAGPSEIDGAAALRARVVLSRRVALEALAAHCSRRLSPHKVPSKITVVESL
jgi:acyl-CoA synthetase (AMP-forming)/AMP-acid ligase II